MDCELMESIATYKPLIYLMITQITVTTLAIPLVCFIMNRIAKNPLYHINTRVLLIAHGLGLIFHLVSRFFYFGIELYRFLIILPASNSACDIIVTSERCFGVRFGFNFGMWFCICTTPVITLERFLATWNVSKYYTDRKSWCFLLGFQFILALILLYFLYAETTFGNLSYYCLAASTSYPKKTLIAFSTATIVQATSLIIYKLLMRKNKKMRAQLHAQGGELTKRYQIEETIRSLKILLLPIFIMFIFQFSYSFLSFFIIEFNEFLDRPTFYFAMESVILFPVYSIIFVILFIKKEKRINNQSTTSLKRNINMNTDVYFENYNKSWSS